ncbi:MAG: hypothetical protein CVV64_10065 [Candidatus Wallbacteria bacterium HGW-Wallbacteria-1]|jgi:hypothetical protein|uniref:Uncharacterized protein n=1 Tax=Candidatus Wallbacteria bacterium HGW-Wallbacteria-1 TaxID=2013854 RepID=A0A2N1PPU2_9BACT|nr:MAG: hypothetical protein CVV64_10065 [Candidatus Wallbacteria bacterium HGW-Wallbacteria-1]
MTSERKLRYAWSEDIWAVHIEVHNPCQNGGVLKIDYQDTGFAEEYPVPARASMRYNVCRHSGDNSHLLLSLPTAMDLKLFENLDRAFYTDTQAILEEVE